MVYKSSRNSFILLMFVFFAGFCSSKQLFSEEKTSEIIIIKAAGFEKSKKPEGVDAITEATSVGRNVNVVSRTIQNEFSRTGLKSEIILFNEYDRINEITKNKTIKLIIFAGPAYSSQFPRQLREVVPKLQNFITDHKILCTSMTTCRFMQSGWKTVQSFNQGLKNKGIQTIKGLAIHHEYEDEDWESKVKEFAQQLKLVINN